MNLLQRLDAGIADVKLLDHTDTLSLLVDARTAIELYEELTQNLRVQLKITQDSIPLLFR